jgi:nucleoside-diphosphate-sugar epimerase
MRILIIGGTGLISGPTTKGLLTRGDQVVHFNRGWQATPPPEVQTITGDRRNTEEFETRFADEYFDAVIDMVCYNAGDAESDVRAFSGRTRHFIFCSTVCVYGDRVPHSVFIDEDHPRIPISKYARGKLEAEQVFQDAFARGALPATVMRPTRVYGPTAELRHNTGAADSTWDRLEHGLPILCSGDGLAMFQLCHCDEVATAFVHALCREKTIGEAYNVTPQDVITWREFYGVAAASMGQVAHLLYAPASWIIAQDPHRFLELRTIFKHHGVYSTDKIRRDVPEFGHWIPLQDGLAATLQGMKARNEWPRWQDDLQLSRILETVGSWGVEPEIADFRQ